MSSPRLPIELCEAVINNLDAHHDKTTLRACSLTCKSFLPASRYRLFYRVYLHGRRTGKRFVKTILLCPMAAQAQDDSPTSPASCVRHLSINDSEGQQRLGSHDGGRWVNEALPILTTRLLEITVLEFRSVEFCLLDDAARAVAISGFQKVKHLKVVSCRFETLEQTNRIIASFPSLTELVFCPWTSLGEGEGGGGTLEMSRDRSSIPLLQVLPPSRHLNVINLDSSHSTFFDRLFSFSLESRSISTVHTVNFWHVPFQNSASVGKMLKTLGSSLEHLDLGRFCDLNKEDDINLAYNTKLRTISLPYGNEFSTLLPTIKSSQMERVSIRFFCHVSQLYGNQWAEIEHMFAQRHDWAGNIREIVIARYGTGDRTPADFIRTRLPALDSRGLLRL